MNNFTIQITVPGIRPFALPAATPGDAEGAHDALNKLEGLGLVNHAVADQARRLLNTIGNLGLIEASAAAR